jgi:hypothetical protein
MNSYRLSVHNNRNGLLRGLHLLRYLGLDKILSDPDMIVIKSNSYSHLLQGGAHDIIMVTPSWPLIHHVLMDFQAPLLLIKGRLRPPAANILGTLGKVHPRVAHTCTRIGLTGALVRIGAAILRVRLQEKVAMGASDSGEGIIEGVIGKAAVLTTLVDQAEYILFELVDCILGNRM